MPVTDTEILQYECNLDEMSALHEAVKLVDEIRQLGGPVTAPTDEVCYIERRVVHLEDK